MFAIMPQGMSMGTGAKGVGSSADAAQNAPVLGAELSEDQLGQFAEWLGMTPEQLDPNVVALLQQWWLGGGALPEMSGAGSIVGEPLPLARASSDLSIHPAALQAAERLRAFAAGLPLVAEKAPGGTADGSAGLLIDGLQTGSSEQGLKLKPLVDALRSQLSSLPSDGQQISLQGGLGKTSGLAGLAGLSPTNLAALEGEGLPGSLLGAEGLSGLASSGALAGRAAMPAVLTQNLLAMPIPQPINHPGWGQAMADRVVWMVRGEMQTAELKITPPNLGPLEVKLTINNEQASVSFVSNHAQVRDAIESALPRLREMFDQQAINLADVNVGERREQSGHAPERQGGVAAGTGGTSEDEEALVGAMSTGGSTQGQGLVDLFV